MNGSMDAECYDRFIDLVVCGKSSFELNWVEIHIHFIFLSIDTAEPEDENL